MLKLHTSNRLETLAESLADTLREPLALSIPARASDGAEPGHGPVAEAAIGRAARHLRQLLVPVSQALLRRGAGSNRQPDEADAQGREVMLWEILRLLPEMLDQPEFSPLKHYLADAGRCAQAFPARLANRQSV